MPCSRPTETNDHNQFVGNGWGGKALNFQGKVILFYRLRVEVKLSPLDYGTNIFGSFDKILVSSACYRSTVSSNIFLLHFLSIIYCFCFRSTEMDSSVSVFSLLLCLLYQVTAQNGMCYRFQKHLVWNL